MKNITIRSILIGTVFTALFAALTVVLDNRHYMLAAPNQVLLFPCVLLIALTVVINPLLRLCRFIKPLALSELLLVFAMCSVASGIATFGLTAQLVPIISAVFNRHWNTDQTEWNRYVEPYLNENFFISEPGGQALAQQYAEKLAAAARDRDLLAAENAKDAPDASAVNQLQDQIAQAEQDADALRQALQEHREKAFAKVDVFRRGLPKGKRAYPGVLYTLKDDPASYFRRLARLNHGLLAARLARKAPDHQDPPGALRVAAAELDPVADDSALQQQLATLVAIDQELATAMHHIDEELIEPNQRKRVAAMEDARHIESDIDRLSKQRATKTRSVSPTAANKNACARKSPSVISSPTPPGSCAASPTAGRRRHQPSTPTSSTAFSPPSAISTRPSTVIFSAICPGITGCGRSPGGASSSR